MAPSARQAGGWMAGRAGGHSNVTHGCWLCPLSRAEPLCVPSGWAGVLPQALGWVRGMQWGRSPSEMPRCLFAQWTRGGFFAFCKAGWRGTRCLSQKMCIFCVKLLTAAGVAAHGPSRETTKPELRP